MNRKFDLTSLQARLEDSIDENYLVVEVIDPYGTSKFFMAPTIKERNSTIYLEVDLRGLYDDPTLSRFSPTEGTSGENGSGRNSTRVQGSGTAGSIESDSLDRIALGEAGRLA